MDKKDVERLRKTTIDFLKDFANEGYENAVECIDWLEDQWKCCNQNKQFYIRFGDIPTNEKSKIYRGEEEIGSEKGVSVYPAFIDENGNVVCGLTLPTTKTTLCTQQHLLEYDNRPCYLVTGDCVGNGTDGEPLIVNVKIVKEIKEYRNKEV